jgi:hypothetical protein
VKLKTLILLFALFQAAVSAQTLLKAGVARVNVTPPYGTIINGDFLPNYANEIHDSLYAKALAFDNGVQKFVFIVVDNMTLDALLDNEAKAIITRETGLTAGQVMISNTHSHSTGAVIETATVQADMSYRIYASQNCKSSNPGIAEPSTGKDCMGSYRCSQTCCMQEVVYEAGIPYDKSFWR